MRCFLIAASFAVVATVMPGAAQSAKPQSRHHAAIDPGVEEADRAESYSLPVSGTLSKQDLVLYGLKRLYYRPADRFSGDFDDKAAIGRHFAYSIPVGEGLLNGPAYWDYDAATQVLKLQYQVSSWSGLDFIVDGRTTDFATTVGLPAALQVWSQNDKPEHTIGENAFGASVPIARFHSKSVNVGVFAPGGGNIFGITGSLYKQIKLSPDAGRAIVKGMTANVEGLIKSTLDGHAVYCGGDIKEPTLDSPTDDFSQNCVISAEITHVKFTSPTGGVLAEW